MTAQTTRKQMSPAVVEATAPDEYTTSSPQRALTVVDAPSAPATPQGFLLPLDTADSARRAIQAYEELKRAIIQPSDLQEIGRKLHIKKSGWLRIARAFGLTVEPVSEEYTVDASDGSWGYAIVVRAVAPNGASMQGDGMCWSSEKQPAQRTRHNVRAHAYTRATNRAISNLVGGGEVSAEEMQGFRESDDEAPTTAPEQRDLIALALSKPAILQLLNKLDLRDDASRRAKLIEVKQALEGVHKAFNGENVTAELQRQVRVAAPASLQGVDMGAPGN